MQNQGRLKCLKAREDYLTNVLDEARLNLAKISDDLNQYTSILKNLILQVFFFKLKNFYKFFKGFISTA